MKIAVYCSSREGLGEEYEKIAIALGEWLGNNNCELVYGGVKAGMMHTVAQAAHDAGAKIIGIVPEIFSHRADPLCDEIILTTDLNDRKAKMIDIADAFVVLPGGIGTIDEWISTLSHIMVMQSKNPDYDKPIIVVNKENMYAGLIDQLRATSESVFARGKRIDRSIIVSDTTEMLNSLKKLL